MQCARGGWLFLALALIVACDQSVDTNADGSVPDTLRADQGPAGEAAVADQGVGDVASTDGSPAEASTAQTVKVTYKGQDKTVDLSQPTPVTFEGIASVKLSDVIALAFPGLTQTDLTADFMSSDGFKPGAKSNCSGLLPVPGANIALGYIGLPDRRLRWELSLGYPSCLYVKDLAEIELADQ